MALPTIAAFNSTGSPILLTRLGLTVPAASSLTLTDYAWPDEIRQDESLETAIDAGSIVLNYGTGNLNKGDSLKFFNVVTQELRISVRLIGEAAITGLTGTASPAKDVDGTAVAVGDRVLLTAQASGVENGIWVVQAGAWVRPEDFDTDQSASFLVDGDLRRDTDRDRKSELAAVGRGIFRRSEHDSGPCSKRDPVGSHP
jgi:hypothetical protein